MTGHQDCPLCEQHRGTGTLVSPVVHADDLVHVAHRADGQFGCLFVDSVRHTPSLATPTGDPAELASRLARRLRADRVVEPVGSHR